MTALAAKATRARYLLRRIAESPPSFLARKASIELAKRLERRGAVRGARRGRSFSEGYERHDSSARALASGVRLDVTRRLEGLLETESRAALVEHLAGRVPCGPVNTAPDLASDPHVAAREMYVAIDPPGSARRSAFQTDDLHAQVTGMVDQPIGGQRPLGAPQGLTG